MCTIRIPWEQHPHAPPLWPYCRQHHCCLPASPHNLCVFPAAPHLRNSLVKQISLAHIVHLFFWWVCSVQKKDSGSSAHGSPGSSYVLHAGTRSSTQVSNVNQLWQQRAACIQGTQAESDSLPVWLVALQTHALHTPSFVQLVGNSATQSALIASCMRSQQPRTREHWRLAGSVEQLL